MQQLELLQRCLNLYSQQLEKVLREAKTCAEARISDPLSNPQDWEQRLELAFVYYGKPLRQIFEWLLASSETSNFSFQLGAINTNYLASLVSVVTSFPVSVIKGYFSELIEDRVLEAHLKGLNRAEVDKGFGRRLGWYAFVRAKKPRLVIETGVDKGVGSCVLCAALMRNAGEQAPGRYLGTDINPHAGQFFRGPYAEFGEILYGDSLESLSRLNQPIDFFINDSDHSAEYERKEYDLLQNMFTHDAYILGDNAHTNDELFKFAERTGRRFLFCEEKPEGHWYPGAGVGVAFR
jgi:predicted O-methyltransferase YrrM